MEHWEFESPFCEVKWSIYVVVRGKLRTKTIVASVFRGKLRTKTIFDQNASRNRRMLERWRKLSKSRFMEVFVGNLGGRP